MCREEHGGGGGAPRSVSHGGNAERRPLNPDLFSSNGHRTPPGGRRPPLTSARRHEEAPTRCRDAVTPLRCAAISAALAVFG